MITCHLMGGLGNQLFQIFATISYAIKANNEYQFLNVETLGGGACTLRYTFWNTFFRKLQPILVDQFPELALVREKSFEFNELPLTMLKNRNVCIYGYFQSYKYFQEYFSLIYKILDVKKMKRKILEKIKIQKKDLANTISMHFRLGDYKKISHIHPIMNVDYYTNSLFAIQTKYPNESFKIMYFCEDDDLETVEQTIEQCKNLFQNYEFERASSSLKDWEQMLLMSECRHHIIANSSFSWWGAYFNRTTDKMVCYPSSWFGPSSKNNTNDLCPPEWTKIDVTI